MCKEEAFAWHGHCVKSQQDGGASEADIVKRHVEIGAPRVLLTDHATIGNQVQLWKEAQKYGGKIKPEIGIEFYFILDKDKDVKSKEKKNTNGLPFDDHKTFHKTVAVANEEGYENLLKMIYISNLKKTDGIEIDGHTGLYYMKPRITEKLLFENQKGLIVTSGCRLSLPNQHIMAGNYEEARRLLKLFNNNIEHFYLELHIANNPVEEMLFDFHTEFGRENNIKMIPANDYHYVNKGELKHWNLLGGLRRRLTVNNPDKIENDDFYIKSGDEMWDRVMELTNNDKEKTEDIFSSYSELNKIMTFTWKNQYPEKIEFPDAEKRLYDLLASKITAHFGGKVSNIPPEYKKRMREEYEVAKITGNCSYYILVYELIEWCRENDIPVPIGRGSAGGLLMLYILGITQVDPIEFGLLAERASNAQRLKEMDIDLDFPKWAVDKIIKEYLYDKFGHECVANIVNYGTYKMSSAIRSVLRYFEVEPVVQNKINKAIKEKFVEFKYADDDIEGEDTIEPSLDNIARIPEFKDIFVRNGVGNFDEIIEYAKQLEGSVEKLSVHASGLLISNKPIYKQYPVIRVGRKGTEGLICSAFDMEDLSEIGALKLDLLSVNTYDKVHSTIKLYNNYVERVKCKKIKRSKRQIQTDIDEINNRIDMFCEASLGGEIDQEFLEDCYRAIDRLEKEMEDS